MEKEFIFTQDAPAAIGPYSQAVKAGDFLFTSGQLPIVPATGLFAGEDIISQTEQVLTNLEAVLTRAGCLMEDVVKTTVYLSNMDDFKVMNEIYGKHFSSAFPARSAVQVAALPKNALVEIEAIACLPRQKEDGA